MNKINFSKLLVKLVILIILPSCFGSSDIDLVKDGVLELDKSLTVGEAFENYKYFKSVKWESFTTDNGRKVVQVTGTIDFDKHPFGSTWEKQGIKQVKVLFQFLILKDGEHFEVYSYGIKYTLKNGEEKMVDAAELGITQIQMLNDLKKIYDNQPLD